MPGVVYVYRCTDAWRISSLVEIPKECGARHIELDFNDTIRLELSIRSVMLFDLNQQKGLDYAEKTDPQNRRHS